MRTSSRTAFTLIELLVAVAIIVVLLAILIPALDKAMTAAEFSRCLANQRETVKACQVYSDSNGRIWPSAVQGRDDVTAADTARFAYAPELRDAGTNGKPLGIGLLVASKHLADTQLGKIIHCPTVDTSGVNGPGNRFPEYGMDRLIQGGTTFVGGSYWVDPRFSLQRVAGSYSYRHLSYAMFKDLGAGITPYAMFRNDGPNANAAFVVYADNPDPTYGRKSMHKEGYNRVFGDGHGGYFKDPEGEVDKITATKTSGTDYIDGFTHFQADEEIYTFMARDN